MFHLRRAVLRIASSPVNSSLLAASPRTFVTLRISTLRSYAVAPTFTKLPHRWASNESEPHPEDVAPVRTEPLEEEIEGQASATELASSAVENSIADTEGRQSRGSREHVGRVDRSDTPPNNVLYIGNLFFDVTEADLRREFSRFGEVLHTRIIQDTRGLSKGFGYVTFNTTDEATQAMQSLNQQLFEGRRMIVQYRRESRGGLAAAARAARPPRTQSTPSRTLFIGNMSFEMTDHDLNELFRDVRNVIDVRVAIDRRTGQPRGFAHADFIDVPSAEKAKAGLEGKSVYGRQLRIDYSYSSRDQQRPNSGRQQEGESSEPAGEPSQS